MHPETVEKMNDVSKKLRKSAEHEKTIGNAFSAKKIGQMYIPVNDFFILCLYQAF